MLPLRFWNWDGGTLEASHSLLMRRVLPSRVGDRPWPTPSSIASSFFAALSAAKGLLPSRWDENGSVDPTGASGDESMTGADSVAAAMLMFLKVSEMFDFKRA